MSQAFVLEDLSSGWGEIEGRVNQVNLRINTGERVALMGERNSGKYMLFRTLAGLRPLREGNFKIFDHQIQHLAFYDDWDRIVPPQVRRRLGICLEHHGLLSNVNVREGLETLYRFQCGDKTAAHRQAASQAVAVQAERFGLEQTLEKRPYALSLAELRLASLARAFLLNPEVLLLENPTGGIGDLSIERVWGAIEQSLSDPKVTAVISTDDWALASYFCKRWVVMEDSQIIFDGSPEDFVRSGHALALQFLRHIEMRKIHEKSLKEIGS